MPWTIEDKVEWLVRQPWAISVEREEDGTYFARIEGLQGAVAHGRTEAELDAEFWESLRETLRAYLDAGDSVPVPNGGVAPWDRPARPAHRTRYRLLGGATLMTEPTTR